jgi:sporulation protein YlmC with PRC-barrel domain
MEVEMRNSVSSALLALLLLGGSPAASAQATPEPQLITSLPSEGVPISEYYYNQAVYDIQDNEIGDVNDIILDGEGKVAAVIIGVGGLLGAGEKNVAVPFDALKVTEKDRKTYLVMDTTKEALERAPGYTFDRGKRKWVPAGKQE